MPSTYPLLLAGELRTTDSGWDIRSPWSGDVVGRASVGGPAEIATAIDSAACTASAAAALPSHARAATLDRIAGGLVERREELARLLAAEAGKPLAAARTELERTIFVFRQGSEEAKRIRGEVLPLDLMPHGEKRWGLTRRFPLAPISAITPFNFPLLLAAHKLAPAIACGASMILKPPPQDPLSTLALAEIVQAAGYPAGALSIVPCSNEDASPLLDDPRIRMVSFTGSARVGWMIRERAAKKRVVLELGGNAAAIIEPDADLDHAVKRCIFGGYTYSGQSCISVQRILVHEQVYDAFLDRYLGAVRALRTGDPLAEGTDVGPMIDEANAVRAVSWLEEAKAEGARVPVGGTRRGAVVEPAVVLDSTSEMKVNREEIFAPVTTVRSYGSFTDALAIANDSPYGLQSGVFTHDIRRIWQAFETLEAGGIIVNDVSGFRVDHMPYGGVKQSGSGREGVRYAIEEMTEVRLLVI